MLNCYIVYFFFKFNLYFFVEKRLVLKKWKRIEKGLWCYIKDGEKSEINFFMNVFLFMYC